MSRFAATTLDLSSLPQPNALLSLDYEAIRSERIAELTARLTAAGIPFDVGSLESDPGVKLQETDAYRELIGRGQINDSIRAVMLAFSWGTNLDHLGVYYGVSRFEGEDDTAFRERIQLAPEALSVAGPAGAYIFHARAVSADVRDAAAVRLPGGVVRIYIMARTGAPAPALLSRIAARFRDDLLVPLTDIPSVLPATRHAFAITATLEVAQGPDPALIRSRSLAALTAYLDAHRRIGVRVTVSGLSAALTTGGVDKVRLVSPVADIEPGPGGYPDIDTITLATEVRA